jgi:hypothetical protein
VTVLLAYQRRLSLDAPDLRKLKVGPELLARRCQKPQSPSYRCVWAFGAAASDQHHTMATTHVGQDRLIPLETSQGVAVEQLLEAGMIVYPPIPRALKLTVNAKHPAG